MDSIVCGVLFVEPRCSGSILNYLSLYSEHIFKGITSNMYKIYLKSP